MHDAFSTSNPYNITIGLEVKYIAENALLIRKTKNQLKYWKVINIMKLKNVLLLINKNINNQFSCYNDA